MHLMFINTLNMQLYLMLDITKSIPKKLQKAFLYFIELTIFLLILCLQKLIILQWPKVV